MSGVGISARSALVGPAGIILAAWAGSRLLVTLAAGAAESIIPRNPNLVGASRGPILSSLTSWDGWWYLGIARHGYHAAPISGQYHDYAFFPLYPALVRVLSLATPAFDGLIAVLLSNVLFLVALWLLYRLTAEVLDEERALWSAVLLCLFPFSWAFSMAYGESLFLALSLGSLLAAERGRAGWAAILAALAGLTRLPGVLLIVPLALILWRRLRDRRALAWLLLVPVGAGLFAAYVGTLAGSAGAAEAAQNAWGRTGIGAAAAGGQSLGANLDPMLLTFLLTLLAYVFLLVYLRPDRIPFAYALIPILTLASVIASGNLQSIGRLGMVAFPFMWVLAGRRSRWFRVAWPAVSAVILVAMSVEIFAGWYQP
jgi:Mannosyltransferase (PIG-V)